jgi:hypothetical protein
MSLSGLHVVRGIKDEAVEIKSDTSVYIKLSVCTALPKRNAHVDKGKVFNISSNRRSY